MRLGQLARKLALRPSELVDFLNSQNIKIEEGSNTRLEDGQVALIIGKFAPESTNEQIFRVQEEKDEPEILAEEVVNLPEPIVETNLPLIGQEKDEIVELPEVIKAPKIELSGLKVIGKIELPEIKKKETLTPQSDESATALPRIPRENRRNINQRRDTRTQKNPISAAREKEAEDTKKKREDEALLAKEQRTKNYYKKVKVSTPTRRASLASDEQADESIQVETTEKPKSLFGRFFRWLKS